MRVIPKQLHPKIVENPVSKKFQKSKTQVGKQKFPNGKDLNSTHGEDTMFDLKNIKKKLWEETNTNIKCRKKYKPGLPQDNDFLTAFKTMGQREIPKNPIRVLKTIETKDMAALREKQFKE
jgi:hypothetical protein